MNLEKPSVAPKEEQGPSIPTIPAALETEEEFIALGKEVSKMSPEDREHFLKAIDAAEKYLKLENPTENDWMHFAASVGTGAIGTIIGSILTEALGFSANPGGVAGSAAFAATSLYRHINVKNKPKEKMIERLRLLRGFAE